MKSEAALEAARLAVVGQLNRKDITEQQKMVLYGMSTALQWMAGLEGPGAMAIERMIQGEQVQKQGRIIGIGS